MRARVCVVGEGGGEKGQAEEVVVCGGRRGSSKVTSGRRSAPAVHAPHRLSAAHHGKERRAHPDELADTLR